MKTGLIAITIACCLTAGAQAQDAKRIALTYDDAPREDTFLDGETRADMIVAGLAAAGVDQAAFFITTDGIDSPVREQRVADYAAAGHVLANHSDTHPWLRELDTDTYLANIDTAEDKLAGFANRRAWFRYPYLNEAPDEAKRDAVRAGLAERGLVNGYVTVDTWDWHLDSLFQQAKKDGKPVCMAALRKLYTDMLVEAANFYDAAAREYLGRAPAQTMLLHENDMAAYFTADLVAALEADGWEIISADAAYEDPIAAVEPDTMFLGMGRVAALARLAGKPGPEFTYLASEGDEIDEAFAVTYDVTGTGNGLCPQ